jgi:hypothetical protein
MVAQTSQMTAARVPVVVDGGKAYLPWEGLVISRIDLATGDVLPLYSPSTAFPAAEPALALAVDDQYVYVADSRGISRIAK